MLKLVEEAAKFKACMADQTDKQEAA